MVLRPLSSLFFFFNDTATTEIYTLSLHDALPISPRRRSRSSTSSTRSSRRCSTRAWRWSRARRSCTRSSGGTRSEEHTSELQSLAYLVCRLLLEKKKTLICKQECRRTTPPILHVS